MRVARRSLFAPPSAVLLALSLAACAPNPDMVSDTEPPATSEVSTPPATAPVETTPAPEPPDMVATCNADAAQSFVGKEASDATVAEARTAAGAKGNVRVIKPGQPVTMDYRGDRLNVNVDDGNVITGIRCG